MKPTLQEFTFGGLSLYGNPLRRKPDSASLCQDVRVMPGGWLRLAGGRWPRCNFTNAQDVLQIRPLAFGGALGNSVHFAQVVYGSSDARAVLLTMSGGTITAAETGIEQLCHQYNNFATQMVPFAQLPDAFVFGNGWGYHDPTYKAPTPALSWYDSHGVLRYFGLSARANSFDRTGLTSGPALVFTPGSGGTNYNQVTTSVKIYVGLYNSTTGHYSNGIYAGELTASGGTGTITVTQAGNINWATHGTTETAELFYVFYATLDGGGVPYLILLDDLTGPKTAAVGTTSPVSLAISSGTDNGWVLDLTKEMPTKNNAPRQMSCIWATNGRLYGIPYEFYDESGSFTTPANQMLVTLKDEASICWSVAEGDARTKDFVGDPLQSWPYNNISPCPSGERPIWGHPAPNNVDSMVWTASKLFLVKEAADGLHEWDCISDTHGLLPVYGPRTVCRTNYGICWVSQRKQLMRYEGGGRDGVSVLSGEYDSILKSQSPVCAGYFFDPVNFVDRYEVFWSTGSVCHDFHMGAWTKTHPHAVRASAMLVNPSGDTYLLIAGGTVGTRMGIYSVEGQPDQSQAVPLVDRLFSFASGSTAASQELPVGFWAPNWLDYADSLLRKEMLELHVIGDGAVSSAIGGVRPVRIELFADFQQFGAGLGSPMTGSKEKQSTTDELYVHKPTTGMFYRRWYKFIIYIQSHSADIASSYFPDPAYQGDYSSNNFYGSVAAMLTTLGRPLNYR